MITRRFWLVALLLITTGCSSYDLVTLTFDCSEDVDTAPALLTVTLGGSPMTCGTYQGLTDSYTCTYTVTGAEARCKGDGALHICEGDLNRSLEPHPQSEPGCDRCGERAPRAVRVTHVHPRRGK